MGPLSISAEDCGIAMVLKNNWLVVPPNQREYSWEPEHIEGLFEDLAQAVGNEDSYFLGSLVLTPGDGINTWEVADGQQRLATISILLSVIRSHYESSGEDLLVQSITPLIFEIDRKPVARKPKLTLNLGDRGFFQKEIESANLDPLPRKCPVSWNRIRTAKKLAQKCAESITAGQSEHFKSEALTRWVEYLENYAKVVVIKVPDQNTAFVMFETLNDRGLRVSQSDLIKNYLYSVSGKDIEVVQRNWNMMIGTLDTLSGDDPTLEFLWKMTVCQYGLTRERELLKRIKNHIRGSFNAITFSELLGSAANDYVAIFNPSDNKWNDYPHAMRNHIQALRILNLKFFDALLLAISIYFERQEGTKAFEQVVAWSVRFLLCGGGRSRAMEERFSTAAKKISGKDITTAEGLEEELGQYVPSDSAFKAEFANKMVPKPKIARYFLRSIENHMMGDVEKLWQPNENPDEVSLEHIIPKKSGDDWKQIDQEDYSDLHKRLGNAVLLSVAANSDLSNKGWDEKKKILSESAYLTTNIISKYDIWSELEVSDRQRLLAEQAILVWPIKAPPIHRGRRSRKKRNG